MFAFARKTTGWNNNVATLSGHPLTVLQPCIPTSRNGMMPRGQITEPILEHADLPPRRREDHRMGMVTASRDWTIEMLRAIPEDGSRYEIIDGELFVTPSPALIHQRAVAQLHLRLAPYLKSGRLGEAFIAPADVEVATDTMVVPDLFVVPPIAGRLPQSWVEAGRLLLVVEVLSPTTARSDRVRKRVLYARQRIPEYWIVDVDGRVVERWRPDDERPEVLSERLEWRPHAARDPLTIDLIEYFAEVTGDV